MIPLIFNGLSIAQIAPGGVSTDLQLWLRADMGTNNFTYANVPAANRSVSSYYNQGGSTYLPIYSVLNNIYGWAAAPGDTNAYLTLDLGSNKDIIGVAVQGQGDNNQYATKYDILVSDDGVTYTNLGNYSRIRGNSIEYHSYFDNVINTRYVRLLITEFTGHRSMRADVLLAAPAPTEGSKVGMWRDFSSNKFHAQQPVSAHRPTFRATSTGNMYNFNPYIHHGTYMGLYNLTALNLLPAYQSQATYITYNHGVNGTAVFGLEYNALTNAPYSYDNLKVMHNIRLVLTPTHYGNQVHH